MNYTFQHVSLFARQTPQRQLQLLSDYIMEMGPSGYQAEKDLFDERLERYAKNAGITVDQAKKNVRVTARNEFRRKLAFFVGEDT